MSALAFYISHRGDLHIQLPDGHRINTSRAHIFDQLGLARDIPGWECTAYFQGKDGRGTCNEACQWFVDWEGCTFAKGSPLWDGKGAL